MTVSTDLPSFDAEAWAWGLLQSLGGIHLFTVDAVGDRMDGYLVTEVLQVDVRASSKARARARADEALRTLIAAKYDAPPAGGVLVDVQRESGPSWLPDPDGAPRYAMRVRVVHHPA